MTTAELGGRESPISWAEGYAISPTGDGDGWQSGQGRHAENGEAVTEAKVDLTPFDGSYRRVIVVDAAGRRAWGNPIWT